MPVQRFCQNRQLEGRLMSQLRAMVYRLLVIFPKYCRRSCYKQVLRGAYGLTGAPRLWYLRGRGRLTGLVTMTVRRSRTQDSAVCCG